MSAQSGVREAIAKVNEKFMAAFQRGDTAGVTALYTDGAQLLPPGTAMMSGRAAIEAFWTGAIGSGIKRVDLQSLGIDEHGDIAVEVGKVVLYGSAGEVIDRIKYLVVWKNDNGEWKLHRDIWNGDPA